jgi:hypothetical protein
MILQISRDKYHLTRNHFAIQDSESPNHFTPQMFHLSKQVERQGDACKLTNSTTTVLYPWVKSKQTELK